MLADIRLILLLVIFKTHSAQCKADLPFVVHRTFLRHLFWNTVLFFILPQSYAFRKPLRRLPISKTIDKEM